MKTWCCEPAFGSVTNLRFLFLRSEQQFTRRHIDELAPRLLSLTGIDMRKCDVRLPNPARSAEKVKLRNEPKNGENPVLPTAYRASIAAYPLP